MALMSSPRLTSAHGRKFPGILQVSIVVVVVLDDVVDVVVVVVVVVVVLVVVVVSRTITSP